MAAASPFTVPVTDSPASATNPWVVEVHGGDDDGSGEILDGEDGDDAGDGLFGHFRIASLSR